MTYGHVSFFNLIFIKEMDKIINEKLDRIENMLKQQHALQKPLLPFSDACIYLDLSASNMYKHTSAGSIPFYKPNGKKIYFKREDLDQWILKHKSTTFDELENQLTDFLEKKGGKKWLN